MTLHSGRSSAKAAHWHKAADTLLLLAPLHLQSMNPLPFIAMAANCTLGSFYGQITHDWYLWVANTVGVLLSEWRGQY